MARTARVRLFFGEGDYDFALNIEQVFDLEEIRSRRFAALGFAPGDASLRKIVLRLAESPVQEEVREVLRLGLIGAGMDRQQAHDLVGRHFRPGYLETCAKVAFAVAAAADMGVPEEDAKTPGERPGGKARRKATRSSPMAGSGKAGSSDKRSN